MAKRIVAVITAATRDNVIVCEGEFHHALEHFVALPEDIFLELVERVLKKPTVVYVDDLKHPHEYRLFYRLENNRYIVAIVKKVDECCFFTTMYPTAKKIRHKHLKLRKLPL